MSGADRMKTKECRHASFDLSEANRDIERWDKGDRQWAYDQWGSMAEKLVTNRRFMAQV
ncbi:hypothetical protein [Gemmobacter sp. 24YEA27]|uniref:hypothetical protein n=1 Tax=Gemmobacter sp. 24YEA27 TaxID=3040672 RepID=UPI0024B3496D|nr:hypothetical protein [Gemmobacter sp. 24YEA27]